MLKPSAAGEGEGEVPACNRCRPARQGGERGLGLFPGAVSSPDQPLSPSGLCHCSLRLSPACEMEDHHPAASSMQAIQQPEGGTRGRMWVGQVRLSKLSGGGSHVLSMKFSFCHKAAFSRVGKGLLSLALPLSAFAAVLGSSTGRSWTSGSPLPQATILDGASSKGLSQKVLLALPEG